MKNIHTSFEPKQPTTTMSRMPSPTNSNPHSDEAHVSHVPVPHSDEARASHVPVPPSRTSTPPPSHHGPTPPSQLTTPTQQVRRLKSFTEDEFSPSKIPHDPMLALDTEQEPLLDCQVFQQIMGLPLGGKHP